MIMLEWYVLYWSKYLIDAYCVRQALNTTGTTHSCAKHYVVKTFTSPLAMTVAWQLSVLCLFHALCLFYLQKSYIFRIQ